MNDHETKRATFTTVKNTKSVLEISSCPLARHGSNLVGAT